MRRKHYHLIGIGGISMSGVAQILHSRGHLVSGSDLKNSEIMEKLQKTGIKINIGHRPENIVSSGIPDVVVYSSAIPADNCELVEARKLGVEIIKRAQMISRLMNDKKCTAVTGTHGKTTTTAMISHLLCETGFDPTILLGGLYPPIGGNCRIGQSEYFVTEADESDGSFLYFDPEYLVVTNIEKEHMEFFKSRERLFRVFASFAEKVRRGGKLYINGDDPGNREMLKHLQNSPKIITFGRSSNNDLYYRLLKITPTGTFSRIFRQGNLLGLLHLCVPGEHNILNALAAMGIGMEMGISFETIASALANFRGVNRRFQVVAVENGITIVDDYGHHPTEIRATLKAAKEYGASSIITVFQPHRYTRVKFLFDEFLDAFNDADEVIITRIYSASEKPISGISGEKLALALNHKAVKYMDNFQEIEEFLIKTIKPGDLVITMGAGDIWKVGKRVAARLEKKRLAVGSEA